MVMQQPLFMEMMLGGLVRGAPGPVIGIVGYEIFRRAVVELPVHPQAVCVTFRHAIWVLSLSKQ
jgi:hypothetical protein